MLLYLHKTKCPANVGRRHLESLLHKHNVGPSSSLKDVPTALYVCTGCDRCSGVTTWADKSLTVSITTPVLQEYVRNAYQSKTQLNTACDRKKYCGKICFIHPNWSQHVSSVCGKISCEALESHGLTLLSFKIPSSTLRGVCEHPVRGVQSGWPLMENQYHRVIYNTHKHSQGRAYGW